MRAEERVVLVAQLLLDEIAAVENGLPAELFLNLSQELASLIQAHRVTPARLKIQRNKRLLVGFGLGQEIIELLCNVGARTPMLRPP